MNVLFAVSEAYPLVKTGGLGDVAYSLPLALHAKGSTIRLVLPGYRDLLKQLNRIEILGWLELPGAYRQHTIRILQTQHSAYPFPLWIVDCPALFDRPGNPYLQPAGYDWADNAERFTVFARAVTELAQDCFQLNWRPDVVHAHDWQTGLVPAFLDFIPQRPKRIFTIHNLAYGGHFSHSDFVSLQLPGQWWSAEGVEFYGGLSMLKAGIVYSDIVTTVSPTYAQEICTPAFGYGMEGLLQSRRYKLFGILNGIENHVWNPAKDAYIAANYSVTRHLKVGKQANKQALLKRLGMFTADTQLDAPLFGMVSRLVEQKGVDLVLNAIPILLEKTPANFALIGAGHGYFEQRLHQLAAQYPNRVGVYIGYDESLAHLLEAGADMFLMPSRFEPCGLNQMYSLRYGTPPLVYFTGGLADTVTDTTPETLTQAKASGFVFYEPTTSALIATMQRALGYFAQPKIWQKIQKTGMNHDFGWQHSAQQYLDLYAR
jgi:starch synthase